MIKRIHIALIVGLTIITATAEAQYLPIQSHYLLNDFPWNPAVAGSKHVNPANINVKRQWVGINDAPQSYSVSLHGLLFQYRMAMGIYVFGNITGPTNVTGFNYTWGYQMPMRGGRSKLGFGVSGLVMQHVFDTRKLTTDVPIDPAITGATLRTFIPEASSGLYYYSDYQFNKEKRYWFGISGLNLLQTSKRIGKKNTLNLDGVQRYYVMSGGHQFKIFKRIHLEPSFMAKAPEDAIDDFTKVELEMSGRIIFNDSIWAGASYEKDDATKLMIGIMAGGMSVGYSYDFIQTDLQKYTTGSHEISVIFNFRRREIKAL